jgi:hypothetical protein
MASMPQMLMKETLNIKEISVIYAIASEAIIIDTMALETPRQKYLP